MIGRAATWLLLLAVKDDSGIVWGRFDRQRPHFGTPEWAVIIGASTLIIVVMVISRWREKRRKLEFLRNSSPQLFDELSRAHRLDRTNRRFIKRVAAAHGEKNIAAMFIEPEHFEPSRVPASEKISPNALRQLRHELFE